jgi:uncharacterized membrane protein
MKFLKNNLITFLASAFLFVFLIPISHSQTLLPDVVTIYKAKVIEILEVSTTTSPAFEEGISIQTLKAQILNKDKESQEVVFKNDSPVKLEKGEVFFLKNDFDQINKVDYYTVSDPYRLNTLLFLSVLFLILLFIFGGKQGVRGFISFCASTALIFYFLIPKLLTGEHVALVSILSIGFIIILGSYITHGFNKMTTSAMFGMLATVTICGLISYGAIHFGHFTGFADEESVYLSYNTSGKIDMINLLFSSILIGLLGILYDIAIGQAVAVDELYLSSDMDRGQIFKRAVRIGKEHIGALVNTLAIAYLGAALPLLLFVSTYYNDDILFLLNTESFATEIIRILVGSIGLILAVPITTLISVYLLCNKERKDNFDPKEERSHSHSHSHSHPH